jgi:flagellar basal body-associated protein FliL
VNIYIKIKFSDWLRKSLRFIGRSPWLWAAYVLFVAVILGVYRISYALGIFASVTSLFVGVGIAKYADLKHSEEASVGLIWAIKKSLPLAVIMGMAIVICWFIFSALANILNGQPEMIGYFFFDWQYTPENLHRRDARELAVWLYGYANITLIFTLLMLATFASWYSYPLMLFKDYSWSQAKEAGRQESAKQVGAYYKTLGFLIFEAILCVEITPWLTPVLYMLTSSFMFVTYKTFFEKS